jgi:hypothetical protein
MSAAPDLRGARRPQPQLARGAFELRGGRTLFEREPQAALLFEQTLTLTPQLFAPVAMLDGRKLLSRGDDEAGREQQATDEEQRLSAQRLSVALAADVEVKVLLGHSSHLYHQPRTSLRVTEFGASGDRG